MRKLGEIQVNVLNALSEHGDWHPTKICGWTWDNDSHTKKVLDSLVNRELVEINEEGFYTLVWKGKHLLLKGIIKDLS